MRYHDEDGAVTRAEQLNCTVGETNSSSFHPDEQVQCDVNIADLEQSDFKTLMGILRKQCTVYHR